ncbi:ribosomal protein S18-alanine N-acetyltransferase [Gordonia defluvii]|jgi:ribosomal-protein-alanine N-acetyltransferase|uniref:Ribosomal protein S18-alanine N-acetyltransferase n=1 Tax=Gordonia defluvii TaxID=283718 RepID=A0ABP6KWZ8_9ACTN|nr:ribosomal protein S18-alanine N-acetyltransferase [Gordonia sp. UBA5067]
MTVIDELRLADVAACAELEKEMFAGDSPWPAAAFRAELKAPYNRYFAARDAPGQSPIGYAGISILGPDGDTECEIHTIAVALTRRGRGIGRELLDRMLAVAAQRDAPVFLEVRVDNDPAIELYESAGFVKAGMRRGYYQPSGADAFTMIRPAPSGRTPENPDD